MGEKFRISLEAARVNAGLTQKDVCKALKVSTTTMCLWERGDRVPPADKARALCDLYRLPMDCINFCRKG